MRVRVAIVDDEPLAVDLLKDYVQKTDELELVEASTDVFKILNLVQEGAIDLVLLDVQMPELTGIQFMKIAGHQVKIILTTAYTDYAMEGYEYEIIDYLLKPISYSRFLRAIRKLIRREEKETIASKGKQNHIYIKSEYKLIRIELRSILYIEALRDYIAVHTINNEKFLSLENIGTLIDILPREDFIRIHKSYIISLSKIKYVEKNRVTIGNKTLTVGKTYKEAFIKKISSS